MRSRACWRATTVEDVDDYVEFCIFLYVFLLPLFNVGDFGDLGYSLLLMLSLYLRGEWYLGGELPIFLHYCFINFANISCAFQLSYSIFYMKYELLLDLVASIKHIFNNLHNYCLSLCITIFLVSIYRLSLLLNYYFNSYV